MSEKIERVNRLLHPIAMSIDHAMDHIVGDGVRFILVCHVDGAAQSVSNVSKADGRKLIEGLLECWEDGVEISSGDMDASKVKH